MSDEAVEVGGIPDDADQVGHAGRLDAATQVAILGAMWFGYAAVRQLTGDTHQDALSNASRLLNVESALGSISKRFCSRPLNGLSSSWPPTHVAWAVLTGYALWRLSSRQLIRSLAILHPLLTSFVVIVTGHHFVSDVAIGAALAVVFVTIISTPRWQGARHRYASMSHSMRFVDAA